MYIGLLKNLGFLDANSAPTERYFKFLDQSQSKKILAEAIQEAYSDLFAVDVKANELSAADVKNKLRTLTQGKPSDNVLSLMANTFKALANYAEWTTEVPKRTTKKEADKIPEEKIPPADETTKEGSEEESPASLRKAQLHYDIQIHLPESRDQAVYDAIFNSLKKHLF